MKRRPKGLKYRNLLARPGAIYYERVWRGQRFCFSTKTSARGGCCSSDSRA